MSGGCATHWCLLWGRDPRGQGHKEGSVQGLGPAQRLFWVPGPWGPWPRACTRVLCMHKRSLVYTQEILLCIHNKCINVTPGAMLRHYWPLLRHYWPLLRHYWPLLRHYCATIAPLLATIAPLAIIAPLLATIAPLLATIAPLLRHYWPLLATIWGCRC